MLVVAGYQLHVATEVALDLGRTGTYRVAGGASGSRYLILNGYAGPRSILPGTRYRATHHAILAMGLGRHGERFVKLFGNGVGIITVGVIEIRELLAGDQDVIEAIVDIGFASTEVIVSGAIGAAISGIFVTATAPAWVPIATTMGAGIVVGVILNRAIEEAGLKDEVEELLRWAAEQNAAAGTFAEPISAP